MHAACDVMNDMKRITLTFCLHFPALPLQLWRQSEQNEADRSLDQIQATSLTTELLLSKMTSPMHSLEEIHLQTCFAWPKGELATGGVGWGDWQPKFLEAKWIHI